MAATMKFDPGLKMKNPSRRHDWRPH